MVIAGSLERGRGFGVSERVYVAREYGTLQLAAESVMFVCGVPLPEAAIGCAARCVCRQFNT